MSLPSYLQIMKVMTPCIEVQGGDLGCSGCLLELPVRLAQGVICERAVKVSYSQSN